MVNIFKSGKTGNSFGSPQPISLASKSPVDSSRTTMPGACASSSLFGNVRPGQNTQGKQDLPVAASITLEAQPPLAISSGLGCGGPFGSSNTPPSSSPSNHSWGLGPLGTTIAQAQPSTNPFSTNPFSTNGSSQVAGAFGVANAQSPLAVDKQQFSKVWQRRDLTGRQAVGMLLPMHHFLVSAISSKRLSVWEQELFL